MPLKSYALNFEISGGSHTVTNINCSFESSFEIADELTKRQKREKRKEREKKNTTSILV